MRYWQLHADTVVAKRVLRGCNPKSVLPYRIRHRSRAGPTPLALAAAGRSTPTADDSTNTIPGPHAPQPDAATAATRSSVTPPAPHTTSATLRSDCSFAPERLPVNGSCSRSENGAGSIDA